MLPHGNNAIVYIASGHRWSEPPILNSEEDSLLKVIREKVIDTEEIDGTVNLIFDYNPALGRQIEITVIGTDISIWQ